MRILIFVIFVFSSVFNVHAEELETDPSISVYDIGLFTKAAECLSIKASLNEKQGFVSAAVLDEKVTGEILGKSFDRKLFNKQLQLSDADFNNITSSLKKHCPATLDEIKYRLEKLKYKNEIFLEELQNVIVVVIFPEVIHKKDRIKRFEANYTPIGVNSSPY